MNIQLIFQNKVFRKYGVEYTVIGTYVNARTRIDMKHNVCGHIWNPNPSTFLAKTNPRLCPRCSPHHNRKLSNEDFIQEIRTIVGDEYTPLDLYKNRTTKIKMRHNTCDHVWKVTPDQFVTSGSRCPKCQINKGSKGKLTQETFLQRVLESAGEEYMITGTFINTKTKVKTKHLTCEYELDAHPDQLMKKLGARCPQCSGCIQKSDNWFKDEVFSQVGVEYTVIGTYINAKTKVNMQHNRCGHNWSVLPRKFVGSTRTRCPKCYKQAKINHDEFVLQVASLVGDEYSVLSQYKAQNKLIKMKHNKCGHAWKLHPSNFVHSVRPTRCPKCNESKGEKRISVFLTEMEVAYESQYRIPECKYIRPLPFDFAIIMNGKLKMLIEFDGQQHFHPIERRGGIEELKNIQKRDAIKNEYCTTNNIPLLRIPYDQINEVESILEKALIQYRIIQKRLLKSAA